MTESETWAGCLTWPETATMTVAHAAQVMGVSRRTAQYMAAEGRLPLIKVGKRHRVVTAALRRMLDDGTPS